MADGGLIMYKTGVINIPVDGKNVGCHFSAKIYDEPSEYGIEGGRISKLAIKVDGVWTCNYDRGWDIKPKDYATKAALAILLYEYDGKEV